MPLVSICIPAYNNPDFLIRAIESILIQTFKDYEIIITDDSRSDILKDVVQKRYSQLNNLKYIKNPSQLGSTTNWNYSISLANSDLIKILHHDDWFSDENSLQELLNPFADPAIDFVFCQSYLYDDKLLVDLHKPKFSDLEKFRQNPFSILFRNFIPPSAILYRKKPLTFDTNLIWLPDAEFYSRYVNKTNLHYIPKPLVCLNISSDRLTTKCEDNLKLLVKENLYLFDKYSDNNSARKNILKYFRIIIRNYSLYDTETFRIKSGFKDLPSEFEQFIDSLKYKDRITDFIFRAARYLKRLVFGKYPVSGRNLINILKKRLYA